MAVATLNDTLLSMNLSAIHTPTTQCVGRRQNCHLQSAAQLAAQKQAEVEKINLRLKRLLGLFLDELIDRETFTAKKTKLMSQKKTLEEQKTVLWPGEPIGSNHSKNGF